MHFHQEDELATHTVAAAAYGILKDVKQSRGQNEAQSARETLVLGLISMAKDRLAGRLPAEVLQDEYTTKILDSIVSATGMTINTNISELDVKVVVDAPATAAYWRSANKASNFLKHADRDTDAILSLREVDNVGLLMNAMLSYESVAPNSLGFEGVILQMYILASFDEEDSRDHPFAKQIAGLRTKSVEQRLAFCSHLLDRPRPADLD